MVVGVHGSVEEMRKRYTEIKSAVEAMEARGARTSKRLSRVIRAFRAGEQPSDSSDTFSNSDAEADSLGATMVQHDRDF